MGCKSGGCGNGTCSTGNCSSCGTMNVYDWLSDMKQPENPFNIIEVKFKSGRKEYYRNENKLTVTTGDPVIVETSPGHHLGHVSLQGELVRLQMKKKGVKINDSLKIIYRQASNKDLEKYESARNREMTTLYRTREIVGELKLDMKMSDVEFQADNTKATFYYSAEDRVDFRELIKILAKEFKIRVEMRQISLRQEAGRLGGIGSCGRELCCSTWISDFKSVSTSAARYQNLSLNPSKLSGQCGRLKCCLNYELDTYIEALEDIPQLNGPLLTQKGKAFLMKTDIFKRMMWFGYENENTWHPLEIERVKEIIQLNKDGKPVFDLETDEEQEDNTIKAINSELDRMDSKFRKQSKKRKNRNNKTKQGSGQAQAKRQKTKNKNAKGNTQKSPKPSSKKPQGQNKPKGNKPQNKKTSKDQNQGKPKQKQQKAQKPDHNKQQPQNREQKKKQGGNHRNKNRKPNRNRGKNNQNNNQS